MIKEGTRKFWITMLSLICTASLSGLAIYNIPDQAVALIAAIGGNVTAVVTPFMFSNYGENKVKANGNSGKSGKLSELPVPEIDL